MRHIDTKCERHFELHIPKCYRPEHRVYGKCARFIGKLFKINVFDLYVKWRVLHFKRAGYLAVRNKIMDYPISRKHNIALRIRLFKTITAVLPALMLHYFVVHPLLNDLWL